MSIAVSIVDSVVASIASILDSVVVPLLSDNIVLPLPISNSPLALILTPLSSMLKIKVSSK